MIYPRTLLLSGAGNHGTGEKPSLSPSTRIFRKPYLLRDVAVVGYFSKSTGIVVTGAVSYIPYETLGFLPVSQTSPLKS